MVYFGAPEEDFKSIFDLKITLITRANSLKILQTTEIHYWPCNPTEPVSREGLWNMLRQVRDRKSEQRKSPGSRGRGTMTCEENNCNWMFNAFRSETCSLP